MKLDLSRPQVMGILNITPDSFSDGGLFTVRDKALKRVEDMISEGADIIDIGGESTRPGAQPVSEGEEIGRVIPLVELIRDRFDIPVSVDTSKAGVMAAAIEAGAAMINDVRALQEKGAMAAVAKSEVLICLMHMQGEPRTMQENPEYDDVITEVFEFLDERVTACSEAGIVKKRLLIDPGFGFGKNLTHNLALLGGLSRFLKLGLPILVGLSRKSMIGMVLDKPVDQRLSGSLAAAALAIWQGASIVRAHDVGATADVVRFCQAVRQVSQG